MNGKTTRAELVLSREATRRRARLHPWVFSNEIEARSDLEPGELVHIWTHDRRKCWTGYYNPHSLIAARLLDRGGAAIDGAWLRARLEAALDYRRRLALHREALRLVFSESDSLPGLIVDQYGDALVVQSLTAGMDRLLPQVVEALDALVQPAAIVERCDAAVRALEGLAMWTRVRKGAASAETDACCHGVTFAVDMLHGHKTGLYLDQMENNQRLAGFAAGARALDLCCHTGACALFLARAGAKSVIGIDAAAPAVEQARINAARNRLASATFEVGDVFKLLPTLDQQGARFDIVNVDPPAFAKRKKDVSRALRGYRELNRRAMRLVSPRGLFCSSTCSHHIAPGDFVELLALAARDAGRQARIVEIRGQAADHPVLLAAPETRYLVWVLLALA